MPVEARVILDSMNPNGDRLTTIEVTFHRFVLAEFNTHRDFSRNSASSRAIPVEKQLAKVLACPAWPFEWPSEKPGMQGGAVLDEWNLGDARQLFIDAWTATTDLIESYLLAHPEKDQRLHKSLINRLLEPFMWHTVIVSSTRWDNFWAQRCSPLAQPEIRVAAEAMKLAFDASTPTLLKFGEWHTPYILEDEDMRVQDRKKVSAARCARVSYLTHDGVRDVQQDIDMYERLISARPMHASPLEHVAVPAIMKHPAGNFDGFEQLRHMVQRSAAATL